MYRVLMLSAALGALAACDEIAGEDLFAPTSKIETVAKTVSLTSSRVLVEGPFGYCVEPQSIRAQAARGSVVFGNCSEITGAKNQPEPSREAVVSVTATRLAAEDALAFRDTKALEDFLKSSDGRATLSRSGDAETVKILDSFTTRSAVYLRMTDAAPGAEASLTSAYWRSVFAVSEAAVSISVRGIEGGTLSPGDGLQLAREFAANTSSGLDEAS